MNVRKFFGVATSVTILSCCCENPEENLIKFDALKNKVIENFTKNPKPFNSLSLYFKFDKISTIEFLPLDKVNIEYEDRENKINTFQRLTNEDINSSNVNLIMKLDSLKSEDLLQLRKLLNEIAVDKIWVMNNYDANEGRYYKEMDLRYSESLYPLHFHYRLFQNPLLDNSFDILTQNNITGGRLSNILVWYYR